MTNYPTDRYRRAILRWYARATPRERTAGRMWYATARRQVRELAREFGIEPARVAAIVAVLSPMVRWEVNVNEARLVLVRVAAEMDSEPILTGHTAFPRNVRVAWDIARGAPLAATVRGDKVARFWRLLCRHDRETAVVDSIAILAALGVEPNPLVSSEDAKPTFSRPRQLAAIRAAYQAAAMTLGLAASTVQATVWVTWRNERDKS